MLETVSRDRPRHLPRVQRPGAIVEAGCGAVFRGSAARLRAAGATTARPRVTLAGNPALAMPPGNDPDAQRRTLGKYLRYSTVGLQFFLSILIFTGGGVWLDRKLGTEVVFTLLGLSLGFGGGLYSLYRDFFLKKEPPEDGENPTGRSPSPGGSSPL